MLVLRDGHGARKAALTHGLDLLVEPLVRHGLAVGRHELADAHELGGRLGGRGGRRRDPAVVGSLRPAGTRRGVDRARAARRPGALRAPLRAADHHLRVRGQRPGGAPAPPPPPQVVHDAVGGDPSGAGPACAGTAGPDALEAPAFSAAGSAGGSIRAATRCSGAGSASSLSGAGTRRTRVEERGADERAGQVRATRRPSSRARSGAGPQARIPSSLRSASPIKTSWAS
jgi:hypothetical protein